MNLLKLENAIDRCLKEINARDTITIPLGTASGYVIAENLLARRDSPPFDLSAMDGYLVQSSQVESDLLKLVNNPKYIKVLHPFYNHYPTKKNKIEAKKSIGIDAKDKVLLFFGLLSFLLRHYCI